MVPSHSMCRVRISTRVSQVLTQHTNHYTNEQHIYVDRKNLHSWSHLHNYNILYTLSLQECDHKEVAPTFHTMMQARESSAQYHPFVTHKGHQSAAISILVYSSQTLCPKGLVSWVQWLRWQLNFPVQRPASRTTRDGTTVHNLFPMHPNAVKLLLYKEALHKDVIALPAAFLLEELNQSSLQFNREPYCLGI